MIVIHILFICAAVIIMVMSDGDGYAWMQGRKATLEAHHVRRYHWAMWTVLAGLIMSGAYMAYPRLGYLSHDSAFILKMTFVALLVLNGLIIGHISHIATTRTYASLSRHERLPLLISGFISPVAWVLALVMGLML
jgi:hypothetical protein